MSNQIRPILFVVDAHDFQLDGHSTTPKAITNLAISNNSFIGVLELSLSSESRIRLTNGSHSNIVPANSHLPNQTPFHHGAHCCAYDV